MNIFIGGLKAHHQQRITAEFPEVCFTFAEFGDSFAIWLKEARKADVVIVDQSRFTHSIGDAFKKARIRPIFTDSKVQIRTIIKEVITRGTSGHAYARGNESTAFVSTATDIWFGGVPDGVAEVETGSDHSEPAGEDA